MKKQLNKRQWLWEFSKRIVVTVAVIFVAVIFYACIMIWRDPEGSAIGILIEQISDIFKITVVSYAVKAGFENVLKIRRSEDKTDE